MKGVEGIEDIVIGWDMNGHIDSDWIDYDRVLGGFGERNEAR